MREVEFISKLFESAEEKFAGTKEQKEAIDFLKCIQTYRAYPSIEELLREKPKLVHQLDDIYKLWKKFEKLSDEELSSLAMELIQDL